MRWRRRRSAIAAFASALWAVTAVGSDEAPRELPANAIQPPGASFERHITGRQKRQLVGDVLRDTVHQAVSEPCRTTLLGVGQSVERVGVRWVEANPFLPGLLRHFCPEAGGPRTAARLTPLYDSKPAYAALLGLIAQAQCRIDLMIFGWDDVPEGRAVATALAARARAGVLVRLMIDRAGFISGEGNAHVVRGCPTFVDALQAEPNVRLMLTPDACVRFDHRKVAVIDDRIVWTGGMILTRPAVERWHNFAFLAAGPIVPQYAALFAERWAELGGCYVPPCPAQETIGAVEPNAVVRMVRTDIGHRSLREAVYGAVDHATCHIYLENPYFSDEFLVKKLVAARTRGVDVRAVLTMRGDVRRLNHYMALTANRLLRGGARVYLYPAMTHVKAMAVDGNWAYIGTGNFDELSLRNNREVGLTVRGPDFVHDLEQNLFARDMANSEELGALLPPPRDRLRLEMMALWY
jgi:cardiolipin synthase